MSEPTNLELLRDEYMHIENTIQRFDERVLSIKAWSVTLSMVVMAASLAKGIAIGLLFAAACSLIFWLMESAWKAFQHTFKLMSGELSAAIRDKKEITPLQVGARFDRHKSYMHIFRVMIYPHVLLPHFLVVLVGALFFVLDWCSVISMAEMAGSVLGDQQSECTCKNQ